MVFFIVFSSNLLLKMVILFEKGPIYPGPSDRYLICSAFVFVVTLCLISFVCLSLLTCKV
jgi:hypothetical protein